MPANSVILYAQWEEDIKSFPPIYKGGNDKVTQGELPKTGGYEVLLITIVVLGLGFTICANGLKKK